MTEPDLEVKRPCRIWILLNGEDAPDGTLVVPTRSPYIHLAIQPMEDSDEEKQRGVLWDRADAEITDGFPTTSPRSRIKARYH